MTKLLFPNSLKTVERVEFPERFPPHSFRTDFSEWKSLQNVEFPYCLVVNSEPRRMQRHLKLLFCALDVQRVALNAHEYLHICASNKRTLSRHCQNTKRYSFYPRKSFSFFTESLQLILSALMRPQWEQQKCFSIWMMYKHAAVFWCTDDLAQLFHFSLHFSVKLYTGSVRVRCLHLMQATLRFKSCWCDQIVHGCYTDFVVKIYCECASDENDSRQLLESMTSVNE